MNEEGDGGQPPEFLSTHPNPDNRIDAINAKAESIGCDTSLSGDVQFNNIKMNL
jgi:predicted Zn-dependent protease